MIEIGFWEKGGLMRVKLPIDNNVGYEVILVLVKLFINICPTGCPFTCPGVVDKLLNPNTYTNDTYCEYIILK